MAGRREENGGSTSPKGEKSQKPAEMTAPNSTHAKAEEALAMKKAAGPQTNKPDDQTASEGLRPIENKDQAPSGALDHGGALPAMQRSKFARVRHVSEAKK